MICVNNCYYSHEQNKCIHLSISVSVYHDNGLQFLELTLSVVIMGTQETYKAYIRHVVTCYAKKAIPRPILICDCNIQYPHGPIKQNQYFFLPSLYEKDQKNKQNDRDTPQTNQTNTLKGTTCNALISLRTQLQCMAISIQEYAFA